MTRCSFVKTSLFLRFVCALKPVLISRLKPCLQWLFVTKKCLVISIFNEIIVTSQCQLAVGASCGVCAFVCASFDGFLHGCVCELLLLTAWLQRCKSMECVTQPAFTHSLSLTHSRTLAPSRNRLSLTHSHSLTRELSHPHSLLTYLLANSLTLTHSRTHSQTHSRTHSQTHHELTHELTHELSLSLSRARARALPLSPLPLSLSRTHARSHAEVRALVPVLDLVSAHEAQDHEEQRRGACSGCKESKRCQ